MKKLSVIIIIMVLLLFSRNLFSGGKSVTGEIIFHPINLESQTYSITVTTDEYCWLWDNIAQKTIFQSTYNFQRNGLTETTAFDEPKDVNGANLGTIPWGKMIFSIQSTYGVNLSFTIDLRDENWSQDAEKYWTHDTYVNINFQGNGFAFLSQGASKDSYDPNDPRQASLSSSVNIWSFWSPSSTPAQSAFKVPVTLFNKIEENPSISFGYLNANSHQVASDSSELFSHDVSQTVSEGTLDTTYNSQRYYSFKWSNSIGINQNPAQNIYNSNLGFTTTIEKSDKSITRNFRKVYPLTIKNNLGEAGGVTVNNIYFKDPISDNQYNSYSATGSGYVIDNAFDSLDIDLLPLEHQQYGAKAVNTISYNGHTYQYTGGDFSTSGTDFLITAPTTLVANYKGTQLSSNINAFTNSSQRKIVRTPDGVMHLVYESLGRVWYEISTDNGATWDIMNGGQPLDSGAGKLPAIDYYSNQIGIVFQQQNGNAYDIMLKSYVIQSGQYVPDVDTLVMSQPNESYATDANPVIGWGYNGYFFIVWEKKVDEGFPSQKGLYAVNGSMGYGAATFYSSKKLPNTDNQSTTPTIAVLKDYESITYFQLAWSQKPYGYDIDYCKLWGDASNNILTTSVQNISYGNGIFINKLPSIIAVPGGGARVSWLGVGSWGTFAYFRDPGYYRFWSFGYDVNSTNINFSDDHSAYFIAWSEGSLNFNKFTDSYTLSQIRTFNTNGKYVELSNGATRDNMYLSAFNVGYVPYNFRTSNSVGSYYGLSKTNGSNTLAVGRGGVIASEGYQYYYLLNNIKVDNQSVEFVEAEKKLKFGDINKLNKYLVTKPFSLNSNSDFTYNFVTEVISTLKDKTLPKKDEYVSFELELLDAKTDKVIGKLDERKYTYENLDKGKTEESFKVDTEGLTSREVKLRIKINTNTNASFFLVDKYSDGENSINKEAVKQISYEGSLAVKDYALVQNYPNPFNPSTTINYQLPKEGLVTLTIYDVLGREVKTLVNEFKSKGRYSVNFNAEKLASGVYIYRIKVNDFSTAKKLLLMK